MADGNLPDLTIFTLDDEAVAAQPGETIWEVAKRHGKTIPHLCHSDQKGYRPDGNCRACVVEIDGERTLAASCCRNPSKGMVVKTDSVRATTARALVMVLLLAAQPGRDAAPDAGSQQFRAGMSETLLPALAAFGPELILVSAGFDGHERDPLAHLNLTDEDFGWITAELMAVAKQKCGGRLVSVLEGGYDLDALQSAGKAHVRELMRA